LLPEVPWLPISGRAHTGKYLCFSKDQNFVDCFFISKRWIVDRATIRQARTNDLQYVDDPEFFDLFAIYTANRVSLRSPSAIGILLITLLVISKLGKKLQLRQRVIATATVFFRRFYLKNSYCETDPFIVIAACCYVAAKAEESPVHIKNVISEARSVFGSEPPCVSGVRSYFDL
jgi:cyclin-C